MTHKGCGGYFYTVRIREACGHEGNRCDLRCSKCGQLLGTLLETAKKL